MEYRKAELDKASKLCNMLLEVYTNKFKRLEKEIRENKIAIKNGPERLSLKRYFSEDDETLGDDGTLECDKKKLRYVSMPPLEGDEGEIVDI